MFSSPFQRIRYTQQLSLLAQPMQLNSLIAKQIVDRAKKIIKYSINVMDENGVIIGSSDPSRLHQTHEGALLAIRDNRTLEINDSVASTVWGKERH